jgi:hypothetical protein
VARRAVSAGLKGGAALKKHLAHIVRQLGKGAAVKVGFLASATYPAQIKQDRKAKRKAAGRNPQQRMARAEASNLPVAQVAFWNQYGTSRTPARPFITQMVESKSPRWGNALGANLRAVNYDSEKALRRTGEGIQGQMVQSIRDWRDPPNAPRTVKEKGFNKPLIDTAVMIRSVDYQVLSDREGLEDA